MQEPEYHKLLLDQISQTLGEAPDLSESVQALLRRVSDTYAKLEEEHKRIEAKAALRTEQLIASTSRAYSFLDSLNMGFMMCDVTAEVVLTNLSVRHILSPAADAQWTLDFIDNLLHPGLELKKLVHQCLATSQPIECDEVNFGKKVLRLFIAPMITEVSSDDKQLLGAVILVEDITEEKVLERSKDDFLSIASHELRTPLTAIRGNASLIKKYYADRIPDKDMAEMIDDIHESSARLINIVNDFLDVSAIEQGKIRMEPEVFLPGEIINDAGRELQNLCEAKSISLQVDPSVAAAPPVLADKLRIKQVVYNLIGNAIKFTDKGGITLSARHDDKLVFIIVTDTGRGMTIASQRLLFRKFQQAGSSLLTRDTTKGTGLGLYISKLIVELSGGKIGLESSEPDKGSVFVFSLPRAEPL